MKRTSKFIIGCLAAFCLFALTACSSVDSKHEYGLLKEGTITVAVYPNYAPFEYKDAQGNLGGIDIDLMNELAEKSDLQVEYVEMEFPEIIDAVENHEVDAAISAITITDARKEQVDFTDPYWSTMLNRVALADSAIATAESIEDIEGVINIGITQTSAQHLTGITGNADYLQYDYYESTDDLVAALNSGDLDIAILDAAFADDLIADSDKYVSLGEWDSTPDEYGIAVNKDCEGLLDLLNSNLDQVDMESISSQQ